MKKILFLLLIAVSIDASATLYVDSVKINKTNFERGESVELLVYFYKWNYDNNDLFEVTIQHLSECCSSNQTVLRSIPFPGVDTLKNKGTAKVISFKIPADFDFGTAQIYVTRCSTKMNIFVEGAPVSTSVLSPLTPDQKEGNVYYYTYTGILAGTAKTKEKPNLPAGLYIFRIEYFDNSFASGKIVF